MVQQLKCEFIVLALVVAWALPGAGQTLFPSPEHQKMDYFAGDGKMQDTMKLSPSVPGGDFTPTEHSEWVSGNFFLQTKSSMHSVMGDTRGVRVMEYNADDKVYTHQRLQQSRRAPDGDGHVLDNTWTWTSEAKLNGVIAKGRYTITVVTPVAYTFKYETLTSTGSWATVMEGKATRSQ